MINPISGPHSRTVRPEPAEGLSFFGTADERKEKPFDRARASGEI
jgi:hypothetical protein